MSLITALFPYPITFHLHILVHLETWRLLEDGESKLLQTRDSEPEVCRLLTRLLTMLC